MLTSVNHLNNGRLGNIIMRHMALMGIANNHGVKLVLPNWDDSIYFEGIHPVGVINNTVEYKEPTFKHCNFSYLDCRNDYSFNGYYQSELYFQHYKEEVKKHFTFKQKFKDKVSKGYDFSNEVIAIHIRRGDYVSNESYLQLPILYYILAIFEIPDWQNKNIIIFSDSIEYCKVHFGCLPNVRFSENLTPIEDMCLMSLCNHFIISNSTFSWVSAWIGEKEGTKVIRPNGLFDGSLKKKNDSSDFYPERWTMFDHEHKQIDLTDVTFTIPVSFDHEDRRENLSLCLRQLEASFDTNIIVGEQDGWHFNTNRGYYNFQSMEVFHRTKMLNDMAKQTDTPLIFNWDADVLIAPLQIWAAVNQLRNGADMVFPYDGRFARMPRNEWYNKLNKSNDIGLVAATKFKGMSEKDTISVGGAVGFKKSSFIEGGMENEHYISYSPEDVSRDYRFRKLGYTVERVKGCLYHLDHFIGVNSNTSNPYFKQGLQELAKEQEMSKEELKAYIQTWAWCKD